MSVLRTTFVIALIALAPQSVLAADINVTTSNYKSKLPTISTGDTVNFASGNYSLNSTDKSHMQRARRVLGAGSGSTTLNWGGKSAVQMLTVSNRANMRINNLYFKNCGVVLDNCDGSHIKNCRFDGHAGKTWENDKKLVQVKGGSHGCLIQNLNIDWDNTSVNLNPISVNGSNNCTVQDNVVTGRLEQGIVMNGATGGLIRNNQLTRDSGTPGAGAGGNVAKGEDHAIYVLNCDGTLIDGNNRTVGWSTQASGHGLKLKDVKNVTANGNNFKSGIIGRVAGKKWFSNVTIKNNTIQNFGINVWTPGVTPSNLSIFGNNITNGSVTVSQ
jgi:parallel beta-helix repeat protein